MQHALLGGMRFALTERLTLGPFLSYGFARHANDQNTSQLHRIAIGAPATRSVIGRNTEDQMLIGVFWGYVAMMEGLIARMKAEIGRPTKVVATGGLSVLFDDHTDIFDVADTDLTIRGLQLLARRTISKG